MTAYLDGVIAPVTIPPASPAARALRAVGRNLDALGDLAVEHSAKLDGLTEMGEEDSKILRRLESKIDRLLLLFEQRISAIEEWQGEHAASHARALARQ